MICMSSIYSIDPAFKKISHEQVDDITNQLQLSILRKKCL